MSRIKLNKNVHKYSITYELTRVYFRPLYRLFYRRLQWHNRKALPKKRPVILAINHQNALMDALIFVHILGKEPFFVARADIFKKRFTAKVLMWLKILPVFRLRDGAANLKHNEETFKIVISGLQNNKILGIMPEGSHGDKRQLRPLKKGIFRMAFSIQEKFGTEKGAVIIPVGLEYSHYSKAYQDMLVNFGAPIEVADYYEEYVKEPAITLNKMTGILAEKMSEVMIDIQQEEYYEMFDVLRKMYRKSVMQKLGLRNFRLHDRFLAEKKIIAQLDELVEKSPQEAQKLNTKTKLYHRYLKKWRMRDWNVSQKKHSFWGILLRILKALVLLPIFIAGFALHFVPFNLPVWLTKDKIKDPQFYSSFRWGIVWVLYLLFLPVYTLLMVYLLPELWMKITGPLLILPLAWFSLRYYAFVKKILARIRFNINISQKNKGILKLQTLKKEIFETMDKLLK